MKQHLDLDMEKMAQILEIKRKVFRKELSLEEARELVNRTFDRITAEEFAYGEQQMLEYGITDEAMIEEMDDIIDVFRDVLVHDESQLPEGHPIRTYQREADALQALLERIEAATADRFVKNEWLELYDRLQEINVHFARKQNQLFPVLERKGFDRPSKVMWTFDNRVRDSIRDAHRLLERDEDEEFLAAQETVLFLVRDILEKEREVLYPTSLKLITNDEFAKMRRGDDEIGYCLIDPPPPFGDPAANDGDDAAAGDPAADTPLSPTALIEDLQAVLQRHGMTTNKEDGGELDVSTGKLTLDRINLLFKHMPVDLSYVDENDIVRFYSDTKHHVFPRSPGVIGREVQNCHPKGSVETVQEIINAFRAGRRDRAEFWLDMGGTFVYILYTAVRDENGTYRGVLEMMQDVTHIRGLSGSQRLLNWSEGDTDAPIGPDSVIGPIVERYPFIRDYLASLNSKFKKLKNPILFKTMGRIATLSMIAERGGMEVGKLIELLSQEIERRRQERGD